MISPEARLCFARKPIRGSDRNQTGKTREQASAVRPCRRNAAGGQSRILIRSRAGRIATGGKGPAIVRIHATSGEAPTVMERPERWGVRAANLQHILGPACPTGGMYVVYVDCIRLQLIQRSREADVYRVPVPFFSGGNREQPPECAPGKKARRAQQVRLPRSGFRISYGTEPRDPVPKPNKTLR
jgi:hypothetical protein